MGRDGESKERKEDEVDGRRKVGTNLLKHIGVEDMIHEDINLVIEKKTAQFKRRRMKEGKVSWEKNEDKEMKKMCRRR